MSQYEPYKNWTKEMDELQTATNDETHCRFYAILAYYMAEMSLKLAVKLAMSAVKPMLHAVVDDDVRPRDLLFSFEDWRNGEEFPTFVSVSDVPFLEQLTKNSSRAPGSLADIKSFSCSVVPNLKLRAAPERNHPK